MSVFSRLFGKKKVQPEVRVNKTASLESLSPEALIASALAEKGGQDDRRRLWAIARLTHTNSLTQWPSTSNNPEPQLVATQRLPALVDARALDLDQLATYLADSEK